MIAIGIGKEIVGVPTPDHQRQNESEGDPGLVVEIELQNPRNGSAVVAEKGKETGILKETVIVVAIEKEIETEIERGMSIQS